MNLFCALEMFFGGKFEGGCVCRAGENVVLFLWVFCPQGSMDVVKDYYRTRILSLLSLFCKMYTLKVVRCVALSQAEISSISIIFRALTETENRLVASAFRRMASCLRRMCLRSSKLGSKR